MQEDEFKSQKKQQWIEELHTLYPQAPKHFLDLMIDVYFINPQECAQIIEKHMNDEIKI